jgi:hypothetical protein
MEEIEKILNGYLPATTQELIKSLEHCNHIIEDSICTIQDPEVAEHDKARYRAMKVKAIKAKNLLQKSI